VETFLTQLSQEVHRRMERAEVTGTTLTLKVKKRKASASHTTVKYLGHGECDNVSKSVFPSSPLLSLSSRQIDDLPTTLP
jgi:DNA repair protein REV1